MKVVEVKFVDVEEPHRETDNRCYIGRPLMCNGRLLMGEIVAPVAVTQCSLSHSSKAECDDSCLSRAARLIRPM